MQPCGSVSRKIRIATRLFTLIAFFQFSGIHNGYAVVQAFSTVQVSQSAHLSAHLIQEIFSGATPVWADSSALAPFKNFCQGMVFGTLQIGSVTKSRISEIFRESTRIVRIGANSAAQRWSGGQGARRQILNLA